GRRSACPAAERRHGGLANRERHHDRVPGVRTAWPGESRTRTEVTEPIVGTMEVLETHRFDVAALERYMRERVAAFAGPLVVRQFVGGQSNPTYHLRAGDTEYVLRRKPPGKLLPSAHAVDREYRAISALAGTGVPVPKSYALCEDPAVIGTAF